MRLHDLSMVFNDRQIHVLEKILETTDSVSVSDFVSSIIRLTIPYLKLKHFKMLLKNGGYRKINWTKKLHIVMREIDYRFLKLLHINLETHGIAVIIRELLELVFSFYNNYGINWLKELLVFLELVKSKIGKKKCWTKYKGQFPDIYHYRIDYNKNFEVIQIQSG